MYLEPFVFPLRLSKTTLELVEQVMTDYGIKPEVIERVKRRVPHTNKYERDPVQFRRLLEGQRLKQSTVQMIVEDVFDEYIGARVPGSTRYMGYERYMRQPYNYAPYSPYEAPILHTVRPILFLHRLGRGL